MFLSNGTMLIAYASGKVAGKAQNHSLMTYGLPQPASIKMSAFVMHAKKEALSKSYATCKLPLAHNNAPMPPSLSRLVSLRK